MDLTLDEKIRLIEEEGKSASEVHKDPNAGMAFVSLLFAWFCSAQI